MRILWRRRKEIVVIIKIATYTAENAKQEDAMTKDEKEVHFPEKPTSPPEGPAPEPPPMSNKIEIDTETKTIYVDENMTPEEFEVALLNIAMEKGISISIQDSDPQLIEENEDE